MKPTSHKSNNTRLVSPEGWEYDVYGECSDLPITQDGGVMYSFWRPSLKERLLVAVGKPVRLGVFSSGHPPVSLDA